MDKGSVLFVDDEPILLAGMWNLFGEDFKVFTAADAEAALDVIGREHIDVIVSDYKMPGRDGLSLLIEAKQRHPEVIRVLMTAYADMQLVVRAMNLGEVHRFIAKPFKAADLRAMLQECAALARLAQPGPHADGPRTVLVAHDSAMTHAALRLLLRPIYDVLFTTNGIEAMNTIASRRIDAVVLGVGLELLDGCTIATYLRHERKSTIPLVFWTGGVENGFQDYLKECGADLVLDQRNLESLPRLQQFLKERLG